VRIALAASVVDGYIRLRALDAQLAIAQETLATRADGLRLTRRVAAGYSPALEGDQAQSEYETAAQLVPALQLSITQQENTLRILLGDSPGTIERGAALADWTVPPPPHPSLGGVAPAP
jgi:outer membrane protein TolC